MTTSLFRGYDQMLKAVRSQAIKETTLHLDWLRSQNEDSNILATCINTSEKKLAYMQGASHRSDIFVEMAR